MSNAHFGDGSLPVPVTLSIVKPSTLLPRLTIDQLSCSKLPSGVRNWAVLSLSSHKEWESHLAGPRPQKWVIWRTFNRNKRVTNFNPLQRQGSTAQCTSIVFTLLHDSDERREWWLYRSRRKEEKCMASW